MVQEKPTRSELEKININIAYTEDKDHHKIKALEAQNEDLEAEVAMLKAKQKDNNDGTQKAAKTRNAAAEHSSRLREHQEMAQVRERVEASKKKVQAAQQHANAMRKQCQHERSQA